MLRTAGGALAGGTVEGELQAQPGLYLYMLLGCLFAFVGFGAWVGLWADRLAEADALHVRESITDALTGLYNPREFHRRFTDEPARAPQWTSAGTLDAGSGPLQEAQRHARTRGGGRDAAARGRGPARRDRATDVPCRIGGEEFGVLCPDTTEETAHALADRLRATIEGLGLVIAGAPVRVTASFGAGEWREGQTQTAFYEEVDAALYRAKGAGRNQVQRVTA